MNDVVSCAENKLGEFEHVVRSGTHEVTDHAEQTIYQSKNDAELASRPERPFGSKVQRNRARNQMYPVMCLAQVRAKKVGLNKSNDSHQNEHNTDERCDGLCHSVSLPVEELNSPDPPLTVANRANHQERRPYRYEEQCSMLMLEMMTPVNYLSQGGESRTKGCDRKKGWRTKECCAIDALLVSLGNRQQLAP